MHTLQLSFWDIRGKRSFFRNLPHINHMRNDTKMLNGVVSAGSYKMNCLKAEVGLSFDISLFTKRDKNWITQFAFFSKIMNKIRKTSLISTKNNFSYLMDFTSFFKEIGLAYHYGRQKCFWTQNCFEFCCWKNWEVNLGHTKANCLLNVFTGWQPFC